MRAWDWPGNSGIIVGMERPTGETAGRALNWKRGGAVLAASFVLWLSSSVAGRVGPSPAQGKEEESRPGKFRLFRATFENGQARRRQGDYQEAIQLFSEALDLARELAEPENEVRCLALVARMNWAAGFPEESQRLYSEALDGARAKALGTEIVECRTALEIGELYIKGKADREARRIIDSADNFRRAAELARRSGSKEHELKCLRQLGLAQAELGDRAASLATSEEALRLAREIHDRREEVKFLLNIGGIRLADKDFTRALNSFDEGLDLSRAIGASQDEASCLRNIGLIMTDLGFIERALDCLRAFQEIAERSWPSAFLPNGMAQLGVALRKKAHILGSAEDLLAAYDVLSNAADLAHQSGNRLAERVALNALGNVCFDRGKSFSALHYYDLSAGLSEGDPDPLSMIEILTNMGLCHLELGHIAEAEALFVRALALGDRSGRRQVLWEPLFYLGRCFEASGRIEEALESYRNSIEAIEHVRSQLTIEDYRVGFARGKIKVYERLIVFLADLAAAGALPRGDGEIFETMEKAKARAFLESLGGSRGVVRDALPEPLKEREKAISSRITAIIGDLSREDASAEQRRKWGEDLRLQEDEYLRLVSRMREEMPGSAEVVLPQPIRMDEARAFLRDERAAILEYALVEDRAYLFVITKGKASLLGLASPQETTSSVRAYVRLLSQLPEGNWEGGWAAAHLAERVLFPALRMLPDTVEHLVIIPDGYLAYLPFETLPLPPEIPASKGSLLISRYSVSYAPSCSSLLSLRRTTGKPEQSKDFLAFGNPEYGPIRTGRRENRRQAASLMKDLYEEAGFELSPLRQSGKEIRKISRRFPREKRAVFLGKAAREEAFKEALLEEYRILHFACHAFLDDRVPFRSGLFLSPGGEEGEDGLLQAREIAALRTNAVMVVLSACQTSRGHLERGEGVMGLTRAFFTSGARSVLSTLWEIEDRVAAVFMGHFYDSLSRGETLSQALRSAKLRMSESGYDHPFYWAAFVLNGEPFSRIAVR